MSAFLSWVDAGGRDRRMYFDATVTQGIVGSQQITDHAVEKGANIVDHSRALPDTVTLEVFVTNAPIDDLPDGSRRMHRDRVSLRVATRTGNVLVDDFAALQFRPGNYVRETFELLTQLRTEATLLEVSTDLQAFDSMLIQSVEVQDSDDGDAATFTIRMRNIRIAVSEEVNAPKIPVAKKAVAKGKQDTTTQTGNGQQKSVLEGLKDMLPDNVKSQLPFGLGG